VAASDGPVPGRIDAVRLLGLGPADKTFETLPDLLDARQPSALQLATIQSLADLPDRRVGPVILGHWKNLSPAVRREAAEALFSRADRLNALLDAVTDRSFAVAEIDPTRLKQLLAHPDARLKARAESLLGSAPRSSRGEVISSYRPSLSLTGDRERGREVFRKVCATCHKAEGQGVDVGPNLATVTGRTPEDLLVHILDPNREVAPAYLSYNVATTDGRVLTGVIAEESANAVTLKRAEGATDVVPRSRIETIASSGVSLMPEGLEKGLVAQDFADLINYVRNIQAGGQTGGR
jgi:putative heme-binding domain-containing protein